MANGLHKRVSALKCKEPDESGSCHEAVSIDNSLSTIVNWFVAGAGTSLDLLLSNACWRLNWPNSRGSSRARYSGSVR